MSWGTAKHIKWACARQNQQNDVRPAKTQINLGIRPVWSVLAVRFMGSQGPSASSCCKWRLRSDWADAQADLSLCWAHRSFCWFVVQWLICLFQCEEVYSGQILEDHQEVSSGGLLHSRTSRRRHHQLSYFITILKTFLLCLILLLFVSYCFSREPCHFVLLIVLLQYFQKKKLIIWNICQIINTIARHVSSYNLSTQVFFQLMGLDSDWRRWKSNLKLKGGMINLLSFCCSAFHSKT